jgi:hypothetical protein
MNEENQSVSSEDSGVVKRGRGRPRGSVSNKPKAPKLPKPKSSKTKSRRIPNELLPLIDNLLLAHKRNSRDGRTTMRNPGSNQKRFSSKSEIREIPLEFLPSIDEMVATWRAENGVHRTRRAQQKSSD